VNYSQFVLNEASGTPYLITGIGITPDYIYPMVSLDRLTPNPENECINFVNDVGYERIFDSFRSNAQENFLVCKVIDGSNVDSIIKDLNEWCRENMTWPSGVTAVYAADDVSNHLSTSALRITFIPKLIESVSYIDLLLTLFFIVLTLIIS
jgi:putative ABC transport system permease protein